MRLVMHREARLVNNNRRTFFRCCLQVLPVPVQNLENSHKLGWENGLWVNRWVKRVCHFLSASDPTHKATGCQTVNAGHQSCSGVHTQSSSWALKAFTDYINEEQSVVQQKMTVKCT